MRTAGLTVQNGRRGGLDSDDLDIGILLLQILADTRNGTTSAHTSYEDVDLTICVVPNLDTRGSIVLGRVGRILKLLEDNAAWDRVAQLLSSTDSTSHSVLATGQAHLSAIGLHQIATLHAHGLGHGENEVIATNG